MQLGNVATAVLDQIFAELMELPPDYVGPLMSEVNDESRPYRSLPEDLRNPGHRYLHLIIDHLAERAKGASYHTLTVRRATSDLIVREHVPVVLALCPLVNASTSPDACTEDTGAKTNHHGHLTDYQSGIVLFTLDGHPEVLEPAPAQVVRDRREEYASYRRCTTRYIWAAEDAMTQWVSSQTPTPTEAQTLGRAERLEVLIKAALPDAKGVAQMDAPTLMARFKAADTPYGKLLYATMLAQLLRVPLD